jgi:hypothetical protein
MDDMVRMVTINLCIAWSFLVLRWTVIFLFLLSYVHSFPCRYYLLYLDICVFISVPQIPHFAVSIFSFSSCKY